MQDFLQRARVAEMANTSNDSAMTNLLSEIRSSNEKHAEHADAFQQLANRLDKMSVANVGDRDRDNGPRRRSPSTAPRRVRFHEPDTRRPPNVYGRRPTTTYKRQQSPIPSACQRCGSSHAYRNCPAQNATCLYCHKIGHFRAVCRQARRGRDHQRI